MKRKIKNVLFLILIGFISFGVVYAEGETNTQNKNPLDVQCPTSSLAKVQKDASTVQVSYEPYEFKPEGFDDPSSPNYSTLIYYMDVKIRNLPESAYIQVTNTQGGDFKADEDNADSDGVITIRQKDTSAVVNYTFEVKARTYDCYGTTLRTIKLSVPKYNAYSKRQVCTDIPDYYLCQPYILYDVNAANFLDSVTKYKEKLTKENASTEKELQNKTNIVSKAAKTISKNRYWIIGGIVLIGVVATVIIVKKKRSSVL